jgi:hypothetical protein
MKSEMSGWIEHDFENKKSIKKIKKKHATRNYWTDE